MKWLVLLLVGTLVCVSALGQGAAEFMQELEAELGEEALKIESLEKFDQQYEFLRQTVWGLSIFPQRSARGTSDKEAEQDVAEFLLSDATIFKIAELREKVRNTEKSGADATPYLNELKNIVINEYLHIEKLTRYWEIRSRQQIELAFAQPFIELLDQSEQEEFAALLLPLNRRVREFRSQMKALTLEDIDAASEDQNSELEIGEAYSDLRVNAAKAASKMNRFLKGFSVTQTRNTDCGPAVKENSGSADLKVKSVPNIDALYPEMARRQHVEGVVAVEVRVDEQGCATHAKLIQSSGVQELDVAAMEYVFKWSYLPPTDGNKNIAIDKQFRIHFQLREDE
jgi:TonB family protein